MIIDFHTHNFPDKLAPRAIGNMVKRLNGRLYPVGDGTLARQLTDMARDGVDRAVMCPIATKPEQADVILASALEIRDGGRGADAARRIVPFASLHPSDAHLVSHLDAIVSSGLRGIKIHPYYQRFRLDDPLVVPFFSSVRDAGLIVQCHCGQDLGYLDSPMSCGPLEIACLLKAVPGLKFVAAHLGGCAGNPAGAVDRLLDFDCFLDTAVLDMDQIKPEQIRILKTWPAERLLFATDYPWSGAKGLTAWIRQHRPDEHDRELIFSRNARDLLGL